MSVLDLKEKFCLKKKKAIFSFCYVISVNCFFTVISYYCLQQRIWHYDDTVMLIKDRGGTSLVVRWLRIHLPVQGMWLWSLVRELGSHRPWSGRVPQLVSPNAAPAEACTYSGAHAPQGKPADHSEDSEQRSPHTQQKWGTCSHLGLQISRFLLALTQESRVLNAQQLEAEPWLADPHPWIHLHQPLMRSKASLGRMATTDHPFQVVVGRHGNKDILRLRIICSLMETVSP